MKKSKHEIITFKVDASLAAAMRGIPNRSEFIRSAIVASLSGACPLCKGTGVLTDDQRVHWRSFTQRHSIQQCKTCHAFHIVCQDAEAGCENPPEKSAERREKRRRKSGVARKKV